MRFTDPDPLPCTWDPEALACCPASRPGCLWGRGTPARTEAGVVSRRLWPLLEMQGRRHEVSGVSLTLRHGLGGTGGGVQSSACPPCFPVECFPSSRVSQWSLVPCTPHSGLGKEPARAWQQVGILPPVWASLPAPGSSQVQTQPVPCSPTEGPQCWGFQGIPVGCSDLCRGLARWGWGGGSGTSAQMQLHCW